MATAICRYLTRRGFRVAPFKAQNMSNNSMACPGGGEIGRSQAAQAAACGIDPHPDMNPILLKPSADAGSQLVLEGHPWRNVRGTHYDGHFEFLLERVQAAYHRLADGPDYVVIEGAGGIAELNLKGSDLVNMRLATVLDATCLLVADIDRGGVFASVIGTLGLLDPDEADRIRAFAVNRFRGTPALFEEGVRILEGKTGKPCLGVFPFDVEIELAAEDGVALESPSTVRSPVPGVGVVALPHISNFTDFRLLGPVPFLRKPIDQRFETIFLPGTKAPIPDMDWLRRCGMDQWILEQHRRGCRIVGVCGGYQIMGEAIEDPDTRESSTRATRGLGLLPAHTRIEPVKTTRQVRARTPSGVEFAAYEIHMGRTTIARETPPFAVLGDGTADGVRVGNLVGTYLHGAFEDPAVLSELTGHAIEAGDICDNYDRLAEWFAMNIDQTVFDREFLGLD